MDIPKELTGEVQKFEDAITRIDCVLLSMGSVLPVKAIIPLFDLYTQPFKPEMIEYFEGFRKNNKIFIHDYYSIAVFLDGISISADKETAITIPSVFIKTLSDFIDAALNSDIKLRWK